MILSQTIKCASDFGEAEAIEVIAKAGFDAVDYSMSLIKNKNHPLNSDRYKEYIALLCETAKKSGVCFNQAHALTYIPAETREESHRLLLEKNQKVIEIAGLMGIKTLVVHPVGTGEYIGNEDIIFERNVKYFRALLPYAEEYGVKLACENMWYKDKRVGTTRGSICSNPYEHARYVDETGSEMFVACIDTGHCALAGREPQDCIRVLGKRLGALHIHDNDYRDDMHTLPGLSEMNWDEIAKALADVDYKGDFTLETNHFFDSLNYEETETGLKLAAQIGRKMIAKIENFR
ncbi:MAG: sugar phosphate isomerase/epimerase [Ruminococcaceae bacterium]|nr:sugar phosphate isomerase/epimerase [Oscillospiraceae bacterium]